MNKTLLAFFGIIMLFLAACAQQQAAAPTTGTGRAVFTITDAAADMGAVTSVKVTIDSVSVHSASEGWVTVSSTQHTFDLLQLKAQGSQALLADAQLKEGTYEQLRLDVSSVVVTDASGDHTAKLPSGELKIVGDLAVEANTTSIATFDFIADESLHLTGKGEYILAPVVHLETKDDVQVDVSSESDVKVNGGKTRADTKVGMDVSGNVGVGLGIGKNQSLMIENGKIKATASVQSNVAIKIGK